jgi:signal transduction histidine kinase
VSAPDILVDEYPALLGEYLSSRSEAALYRISQLAQTMVHSGLGPEDVVALHFEGLGQALAETPLRLYPRALGDAHQFLIEVMIAYGVRYKEYLELKLGEAVRDAEARATRERERLLELERVQREGREILASIAHEMRSPITTVRGNLDLATRSIQQGRVDRLTGFLGTAREAVDRLSRLTADLVEASRGAIPDLAMAEVEVGAVLAQAHSWAEAAAANKGVRLVLQRPLAPARVWGNLDALLSVAGNLLSNAIRYTPTGGQITVRHEVVANEVHLVVADTGIGMSPEVRNRIFERFYRSPEACRLEAQGLGLGLALVQQLVAAHQGRVEVESEPGQGTTFRVILPWQTAVQPPPPPPVEARQPDQGERG